VDTLNSPVAVLTGMITPAVLISACGMMILSDRLERLSRRAPDPERYEERRAMIFEQLDILTSRSRLLQRSMTTFYLALGVFVSTSVAIGIVAVSDLRFGWLPVVLGLLGTGFLFQGSVLLIFEARLASNAIHIEMDYLWRLGRQHAPADLVARPRASGRVADSLRRLASFGSSH
jgi:hypothetical protein